MPHLVPYFLFGWLMLSAMSPVVVRAEDAPRSRVEARSSSAREQNLDKPPANYQPLLDRALRQFSLENYREALGLFQDAHELWPNARALRAIGRCQYELGDFIAAEASLEQAILTGVRPLDGSQREETEQLLSLVREQLAHLWIVTEPPSARVLIDGVEVTLDGAGKIAVSVGLHSIEASASGFMPAHRELNAQAQREERVELRLLPMVRIAMPEPEPTAPEPASRADRPLRKKWWLWTSIVGAAALVTVATVVVATRDEPAPAKPSGGTTGVAIGVLSAVGDP